jgi:hypothetical protein
MNTPAESNAEMPDTRVKHRRLRHEWREASNPLDQFVKVVGWLFFSAVLASLAYYVWQAFVGTAG